MPHSIVVNAIADATVSKTHTIGRHIHALFLNLVRSVDPKLSDALHESGASKPFSLGPLQREPKKKPLRHFTSSQLGEHDLRQLREKNRDDSVFRYQDIPAGVPCWWRISLLDDSLFGRISDLWLNRVSRDSYRLGSSRLHITGIAASSVSEALWADYRSYERIYDEASHDNMKFCIDFFTPTAFRVGKVDSLLPVPTQVFGSLLRRWNSLSSLTLDPSIIEYLHPTSFALSSVRVEGDDGGASPEYSKCKQQNSKFNNNFVGCVGRITYQPFGTASSEEIKHLNVLGNYAYYTGVGRKTAMGFGMCRRVSAYEY